MRTALFLLCCLALASTAQETDFFGIGLGKVFICQCRGSGADLNCSSRKVSRYEAKKILNNPNVVAAAGKCKFRACRCTGPESALKCKTKQFFSQAQVNEVVRASKGTAVRGDCDSKGTKFPCCSKVNATFSKTIKVPAPVVAQRVKSPSLSFGACSPPANTTSNSTANSTANATRM